MLLKNLFNRSTLAKFSPLIIILLYLILTAIVFREALKWEHEEIKAGFQLTAEDRFSALEREIESNLETLLALKAFYTTSPKITRSQFRDFVAPLLSHHPSIQALEWIPRVADSQREAYETAARRDGFFDFEITERGAPKKVVRANKRKEYFPVYFVEPYQGNEAALGFDLASNPARLEALELSRRKGEMVATGRVTLVQETGNQFGVLVFVPVYRTLSINPIQESSDNLEGFVLGVFRIGDLLEKSLTYLKPAEINIYLYDKTASEGEIFLYSHKTRLKTESTSLMLEWAGEDKLKSIRYIRALDFANRKWELGCAATADYITARRTWQPWGVLIGGLFLTGLLAAYSWVSFYRSKRIEQLVIDRTKELQKTNEMLAKEITVRTQAEEELRQERDRAQKYLDMAGAIIIVIEGNQRVSLINRKGCEVLGCNEEEIIGANWFETFLSESSRYRVKELFTKLMSGEADPGEYFENPVKTKSGEEKIIAWRNSLLKDEWDKTIGILSSGEDITERKRAEEALRKSKEEATRLTEEVEVLARIGRIISSTLRIEEVYGRFAEEVGKLIPLDRICITLVNPEAGTMENAYVWGVEVGDRKAGNSYLLAGSMGEEIIRTRKSLLVQTENQDEVIRYSPHLLTTFQAGLRSMLSVPLTSKDQVVGILHIRSLQTNAYTEKEMKLAEEVGNQIAGGIASASLYRELKEAKETLQKREAEFRELYDHAPLGYHEYDREGKIARVNQTDLEMLGYSAEEMIGQPMWKFNLEEESAKEQILAKLAGRLPPGRNLVRNYRRKDGSTFPVLIEDRLLEDERGEIIGIRCTIQDITERKRAEEALRKSEEEAKRLAQEKAVMAEIGRIISSNLNIEEVYTLFSEKVKSLLPYDRIAINLINEDDATLVTRYVEGDSAPERKLGDVQPKAGTLTEAVMLNRKGLIFDGQDESEVAAKYPGLLPEMRAGFRSFLSIPLISVDQPIGGLHFRSKRHRVYSEKDLILAESIANQVAGAIANAQLFSEHERAEKEKASLQQQLHQSQKMEAIGKLAGGIAHDFNNLLTIINTNAQLTLTELKNWDPLKGKLESIQKAGERAANLTRQLLAFSRRQVVEVKVIDLNSLLQELGKMLSRIMGEDIELIMVLDKGLGRVKVDPGQIEQVILNLVVNAKDAMPFGGKLTIETTNVHLDGEYAHTHFVVKPGRYVMLSVSDTGVGMSAEVRERVFEPFFTTKEKGKGTGLGLSTVYGVVKQSGGYIWVYSEPGQGATFKIYLPRVDEPLEEGARKKAGKDRLPRGRETILLVEDEEEVRNLAVDILRKQGYRILEAPRGGDAFLICEQGKEKIQLLLTDVVMPGLNGPELARRLKYFYPEMKVLFMSGYTDNLIFQQGVLDDGMFFLQKPFSVEGLAGKVREVLDG